LHEGLANRYYPSVSSINFHTKEVSVKIVYYGPGLCGKTTSLQTIYGSLPADKRPQLVSLATEVDRTIFFDFLPLVAYRIRDFLVRLQLYTVPGQVFYNATRKLVLNGVDGLVFVADSQRAMTDSNLESLQNLEENLTELGLEEGRVPMVLQYNKRDLVDIHSIAEMEALYNPRRLPSFATVAVKGEGLYEALKSVSQAVISDLIKKGVGRELSGPSAEAKAPGPSDTQAPSPPRSVEEAMSQAAQPPLGAPSVLPAASGSGLWPLGDAARLGERIEAALRAMHWNDVVGLVEQLVEQQARRWAASEGASSNNPVPSFLLMRGVPAARYRSLAEAGRLVRAGQAVGRNEALSALVVALESLW